MNLRKRMILSLALLALTQAAAYAAPPDYAALRADRARGLSQPYGWLSLTALQWLQNGTTTVGSAKDNKVVLAGAPAHLATFEVNNGKVAITAADPSLQLHGQPVHAESHPIISADEDDAAALSSGPLKMWVIDRSGRRYLRVKNPDAPTRQHFRGLTWYAPNPHLRIEARWIPDSPPHVMHVPNEIGQVSTVNVPGHVEFELDGTKHTMLPLEAVKDGLWFVFRDATYRTTTYGGGRFLTTDAPSNGLDHPGTVILDFNTAVNPPCAYSPFATCPLAPKEDQLPIPIPAGEKRYAE